MTGLQNRERGYGITGAVLKNMAYVTMLIDHFFAVLFLNYMKLHLVDGRWDPRLERIYRVGRGVGRVSFVLFTFLIVEGFFYTRSRAGFLLRLFLFALLSEIPFDLALSGTVFDWSGQNVYWTLFLGVLVLTLWDDLSHYRNVLAMVGRWTVLAAGCTAAFFCSTDYRFMGVLLIFVMYQTREKDGGAQFMAAGLVMLFGTWGSYLMRYVGNDHTADSLFWSSLREMYGLFAFVLIFLYNGKKGRQLPKPFYYGFYPVHLLILYGFAKLTRVM
ncbi:MAG: conjugal transfer protein TraX [Lachnospiraceae bacterium]|nr:conjugal transfer protein TraX [Lachnospiraceae bacterium]